MRRPRLHALLDSLDLGHLLDQPFTAVRWDDGMLHVLPSCGSMGSGDGSRPLVADEVTTTFREVSDPTCRWCFNSFLQSPFTAMTEATHLLESYACWYPAGPAPDGTDFRSLQRLAARVAQLEELDQNLQWARLTDPDVRSALGLLLEGVRTEAASSRAHLERFGPDALALSAAADSAASGPGHVRRVLYPLEKVFGGCYQVPEVVSEWVGALESGRSREQRRRRIARVAGALLDSQDLTTEEVRSGVLTVLEVLDVLESRLAANLEVPDPLVVMSTLESSTSDDEATCRLVVETCTVARAESHRLLVGPRRVLQRYVGTSCGVPDPYQTPMILLPEDPVQAENAVRLWDPTCGSRLSTPAGAVEVAVLV